MTKYPMLLNPYLRPMIWGGNRLKTKYSKDCESDNIGESWELTIRPEAVSTVANGEYAGMKLNEVLKCGFDFPLLIKFIDAHNKLSVQVHPDDDITDINGTPLGKTEMWYIIEADDNAHIIYGLCDNISIDDFSEMVQKNDFSSGLRKVPVKRGDCFFIPAGQVHAICEGILLAEIQQNSDTTYRLYDYGRLDKSGKPRELHTEMALKVTKARNDSDIELIRYSEGMEENCLANCDKFKCSKHNCTIDTPVYFSDSNTFTALIFLEGNGTIAHDNIEYPVKAGDTYYIPDGIAITVKGQTEFLSAKAK